MELKEFFRMMHSVLVIEELSKSHAFLAFLYISFTGSTS
jgi:hypothetical protein